MPKIINFKKVETGKIPLFACKSKAISELKIGDYVLDRYQEPTKVVGVHNHGILPGWKVTVEGIEEPVVCTINHKFLCREGILPLKDIISGELFTNGEIFTHGEFRKIISLGNVGKLEMFDIGVEHEEHLFHLSNGMVTSNSHAIAYSAITAQELWLKYNYPIEYITALLNTTARDREKSFSTERTLITYIGYAIQRGFDVLPPNINKSKIDATIDGSSILYSLKHVKGVKNSSKIIEERQPYTDFEDFYTRINKRKVNKGVMISLIAAGAFSEWGTKNEILGKLYSLRKDTRIKKYIAARKTEVKIEDLNSKAINNEEILVMNDLDWEALEEEALGLCLSKEPILLTWDDYITKNRYDRIRDLGRIKSALCFGKIKSIEEKISKAGNNMLLVMITDEIYTIDFFVFEKEIFNFKKKFKVGDISIVGLGCFDKNPEGMRFYDSMIL